MYVVYVCTVCIQSVCIDHNHGGDYTMDTVNDYKEACEWLSVLGL